MEQVSKTRLMNYVIAGRMRECFSHSDQGEFDVTAQRAWCEQNALDEAKCQVINVGLEQIIPWLAEHRVVEDQRAAELPETSWLLDPGIFIHYVDIEAGTESHLMIDGHHRALRRHREGKDNMLFYLVPSKFIIRPSKDWIPNPWFDWGDKMVDGKIIKS